MDNKTESAEHAGLPVAGYMPQRAETVALVNDNKRAEERILRTLDALKASGDVDPRWLATGRTDIEKGFMAINRAIFKPARIELPEDYEDRL